MFPDVTCLLYVGEVRPMIKQERRLLHSTSARILEHVSGRVSVRQRRMGVLYGRVGTSQQGVTTQTHRHTKRHTEQERQRQSASRFMLGDPHRANAAYSKTTLFVFAIIALRLSYIIML